MHCSIPTLNTALVFMLMIHGDLTPSNLERRASLLGIYKIKHNSFSQTDYAPINVRPAGGEAGQGGGI